MNEPQNTDVFLYPQNNTLRTAYQALIHKVIIEKKIIYTPSELILTIIDCFGWEDDSNLHNPEKPPGPRYRKAKNILKTFTGTFLKFTGLRLEVYIFHPNGKRVQTFEELETLCAFDPDLNELIATNKKLDLTQKWKDKLVKTPTYQISDKLSAIDREIAERKEKIRAHTNGKKGIVCVDEEVLGEDFG